MSLDHRGLGMATERVCPEGCTAFLIRRLDESLACPACGYAEDDGGAEV